MKRIYFDSKGHRRHHHFFWQPWGCMGCLGRGIGFMALLTAFLFLLSQFRSCAPSEPASVREPVAAETLPAPPTLPPIDDEDIIVRDGHRLAGNRLNVLFGAETDRQDAARWTDSFKELYPSGINQVLFYDPETKLMSVQVDPSMRAEMLTVLPGQISDIEFIVFEETVMEPTERPSDPVFGNSELSWFYEPTGIYDAWDITHGSEDVIVAVVDSYFDLDNQEFAHTSIVSPYSVANGSSDVSLPDGYSSSSPDQVLAHGTMVSGLIFASPDNGMGAAGISPGCQFMPVSLGHRFGCLAMLQGLLYAINHGAKVVNISAGLSFAEGVENLSDSEQITLSRNILLDQENVWKYVFDMAEKFYVTIVWAAGNDNIFTAIDASKRGDNTIKVSSVGRTWGKANFSNYGNFPSEGIFESTVSAPGEHIYGLLPGTDHGLDVKGTSFSAPIVAGAVGLIKSLDMSLGTRQIVSILQSTGTPVESDSRVGPLINVAKALERVREGFLPYDSLAAYMAAASGVLMVPTTLNSPLELTDTAASTALPPMISLVFELVSPAGGRVHYVNSMYPETPWTAEFRIESTERGLDFVQDSEAVKDGENYSFSKGRFSVERDTDGYARIVNVDSESVHESGFFLKKS